MSLLRAAPAAVIASIILTAVLAPPAGALVSSNDAAGQTLPRTASPMPLIALFGWISLGGAFILKLARTRAQ